MLNHNKRKMTIKNLALHGALLAALCMAGMATAGCSDSNGGDEPTPPADTTARRTCIVYMAGDNSLGSGGFAKSDSAEISNGTVYMNARDQLILYYDNGGSTKIYRFKRGSLQPELLRDYGENLCSSSPTVMRDVLAYIKQRCPSSRYSLACWSHGDGWLPSYNRDYAQGITTKSFGVDVGPGGNRSSDQDAVAVATNDNYRFAPAMDMDSMAWAIEGSGLHFDYIYFDACLMQCLESDYDLRHAADYIVASPISIAAINGDYTALMRDGLFSDNPDDIAATCYRTMTSLPQTSIYANYGTVFSTVKTSELDSLAALTARLLPQALNDGSQPDMSGVMAYSKYVYYFLYRPEFYDAASAMKRILPDSAYTLWRAALDRCVVGKYATRTFYVDADDRGNEEFLSVDLENYSGISMFVPQTRYTFNASARYNPIYYRFAIYGDLNADFRATAWYRAAGWDQTGW